MLPALMAVIGALQAKAKNQDASNQQMNQIMQQGVPQQQQVQPFGINSVFGNN